MQVRKFEAKTIKEAIEMVKSEMGPDAIILSAKENVKKFGLMGETSVEVTAAVSESKLYAKKMAEKKMNARTRQTFMNAPARTQKQFIESSSQSGGLETYSSAPPVAMAPQPPAPKRQGITSTRYAEIEEIESVSPSAAMTVTPNMKPASSPAVAISQPKMSSSQNESVQVMALKNELQSLKSMLERFQKIPQNFMTLHPGAEEGISFELSHVYKKLQEAGLATAHICEILKKADEILPTEHKQKKAFVEGWVIRYMLDQIQVSEKPMSGRYHLFVGPTGQGKTSTVVKIASHLVLKEKKKVAVLSGDIFKVGAQEQLKTYCQILNVPFGVMRQPSDWREYEPLLKNMDCILFDTAGTNLKSAQDFDRLRAMMPVTNEKTKIHYVQSALARDADAFEIADRFRMIDFQDVIFTRLDEAVQQGLIYNFQKKYNVPLHSFGIGSHLPEDFEFASKERVIDMIFNLSKLFKERGHS